MRVNEGPTMAFNIQFSGAAGESLALVTWGLVVYKPTPDNFDKLFVYDFVIFLPFNTIEAHG